MTYTKQYEKAIILFDKVLEIDPNDGFALKYKKIALELSEKKKKK